MFGFGKKKELRSTITQSETDAGLLRAFGLIGDGAITVDQAIEVPAVWDAINFISGTIAGLPLHVFQKKRGGERVRVTKGIGETVSKNINAECSSFQWRYDMFSTGVLPDGRFATHIDRDSRARLRD